MLIRFSVENFLSFNDEVELAMFSGKARKHPSHIIQLNKPSNLKILKTGAIYGANASGKSNLIKAIAFAQRLIVVGIRPNHIIPVTPFKFAKDCETKPTKFSFEIYHNGKAYAYGFSLDTRIIHEEWLYEIGNKTEKQIFDRKTIENKTTIEFGLDFRNAKEKEFFKFLAKGTRANQLFLTETLERDSNRFADVYTWFRDVLTVIFPDSKRQTLEFDIFSKDSFKSDLEQLLSNFDTGIDGIELQDFDVNNDINIPSEIVDSIKKDLLETGSPTPASVRIADGARFIVSLDEKTSELKGLKLMTAHDVKSENRQELLEIYEESDGTQRLFDILPGLMDLISTERVFLIDELDRSLHPQLSRKIVDLFLSANVKHHSQLIFTTHEASLLDLDLLRRDEIWLIEKDIDGMSKLYSLEEFGVRADKDIRKGYLYGRYGAVPLINDTQLSFEVD